ncbi:MAG: LuxR C-terminal-related transcriptional regulator [Gemmatimonadaceae bacterium]|nr:LuxR C-terminal-related transcriptional regulator [Gemmatimonadaceae bacterium]
MIELSRREREVVELIGRGVSCKSAAAMLGLSIGAIEARAGRAYRKLGVHNCREALAMLKRKNSLRSRPLAEQLLLVA